MSLLDLSQVTRALITLIDRHVQASSAWSSAHTLSVVPDPPDSLSGDNTIGLYLYHVAEDPHNKNALPQGNSSPAIRYTPMPLLLYYQLSAHSALGSPTGSYREQLMLGAAIKALHDYPIINDDTRVGGVPILPAVLQDNDNRIQIELRPVSADEAVSFWTAGSSPLRLACYYQVSVILLEPEEVDAAAGPVLQYNVYAFPQQSPYIIGTANTLGFTVPGEASPRQIELRPARVPISNVLQIEGNSLSGDSTGLLLSFPDWDEPQEIDAMAWAMQVSASRISVQVQDSLGGLDIVPGVYSAVVRVTKRRTAADGIERDFETLSNAAPFSISPRIDGLSAPTAAGEFTVSGRLFQHASIAAEALRIFVGETRLLAGTAGALNPGEYAVTTPTSIDVRLPAGLAPGQSLYFRLQINNADSAPHWVSVP